MLFPTEKKKGKIPDFSGFSKKIEIKGLMEPNLEDHIYQLIQFIIVIR